MSLDSDKIPLALKYDDNGNIVGLRQASQLHVSSISSISFSASILDVENFTAESLTVTSLNAANLTFTSLVVQNLSATNTVSAATIRSPDISGTTLTVDTFSPTNLLVENLSATTSVSAATIRSPDISGTTFTVDTFSPQSLIVTSLSAYTSISGANIKSVSANLGTVSGLNALSITYKSNIDAEGNIIGANFLQARTIQYKGVPPGNAEIDFQANILLGTNSLSGTGVSAGTGRFPALTGTTLNSTNATLTNVTGTNATITTANGTNLNYTNVTGTTAIITSLTGTSFRSTNANLTNVTGTTGLITTLNGTNLNYTNVTGTTLNSTNANLTNVTGTNINATLIKSTSVSSLNLSSFNVTGQTLNTWQLKFSTLTSVGGFTAPYSSLLLVSADTFQGHGYALTAGANTLPQLAGHDLIGIRFVDCGGIFIGANIVEFGKRHPNNPIYAQAVGSPVESLSLTGDPPSNSTYLKVESVTGGGSIVSPDSIRFHSGSNQEDYIISRIDYTTTGTAPVLIIDSPSEDSIFSTYNKNALHATFLAYNDLKYAVTGNLVISGNITGDTLNSTNIQSTSGFYTYLSATNFYNLSSLVNNLRVTTVSSNGGFISVVSGITPTSDAHLSTKSYVDNKTWDLNSANITGNLPISKGGTASTSFTDFAVLYKNNDPSEFIDGIVGSTGQVLIGQTGAAPAFSPTVTVTTVNAGTAVNAGTISGTTIKGMSLSSGGGFITTVSGVAPTNSTHLATKNYVDYAGVSANQIWDSKGDLAVGTGSDSAARLAVSSNNLSLVADSSTSTGLAYKAGSRVRLFNSYDAAEISSSTSESSALSFSIPAGTLGATDFVEVYIEGYILNNTTGTVSYTARAFWDNVCVWGDVFGISNTSVRKPFIATIRASNLNSVSKQRISGILDLHNGTALGSVTGIGNWGQTDPIITWMNNGYPTVNTTSNASVLTFSLQMATNDANARFKYDIVYLDLVKGIS